MNLTESDLPIKSKCRKKLDFLLNRTDIVSSTKEQIGANDKLIEMIIAGEYAPLSGFMKKNLEELEKERARLYKQILERKEEVLVAINDFLVCECNGTPLEIVEDRGAVPGEILSIKGGKITRVSE